MSNTNSYQALVKTTYGTVGFLILTAMQFLYPFIAMIGYNVIIGDTVTAVILRIGGDSIKNTALGSRQLIIFVFTVVIMLPLSLYRDVGKISKASFVALMLILFLLITLLVKAILLNGQIPATEGAWDFAHTNVTQAISILTFSYMCHHNSFLIYTSLDNPTEKRWNTVTHISIGVSVVATLLFGIFGYVIFTGHVRGDILLNFCTKDDFINVARFAYAMTIVLTWPLECFVTREVIENSIFAAKEPQLGRHILVTVIIAILTGGISMATDCVEVVLQLNGSLTAIPLAFIFPPMCVLRLQQEPILSMKSIPKLITAIFGIVTAILALAMTILNIAEGKTCTHGFESDYCDSYLNGSWSNTSLAANGSMTANTASIPPIHNITGTTLPT